MNKKESKLSELIDKSDKLNQLLKSPQLGVISWMTAVRDLVKEMNEIIDGKGQGNNK